MQGGSLKSYLNLHLIVFIWGFTGVLGGLISVRGASLVWYRMLLASLFMLIWLMANKVPLKLPWREALKLLFTGVLIGIHWILFFTAIDISNVSVTLAMFSMGAFFAAIFEPIFYGRKMLWYEVFFGLLIIGSLCLILKVEFKYLAGMVCALASVFFGVMFTLVNGKLTQKYRPDVITLYEFIAGFVFVSLWLTFNNSFTVDFFNVPLNDWWLILLLASVCTAYAFTASVNIMRKLTPYTVMLTTNLEPVYGILLAYFIIGEAEHMSPAFYFGAAIIILVVITNGVVKHKFKKEVS
ncbi:DMT family transporter [Flavobacterium silvaticum]|uniref:DMT family transporter n=1 Tax=Flavobacterium silvaticum TaxID=1852020 RepID=A0A972FV42_9FLAO|nr:DMT family transporter [Flavobacterium silvaticum]NMH28175.1 DMT family transporter [Flavobacterium silvaticum]